MQVYREIQITGKEAPWCVDGRKATGAEKGPQMLGGSLHSVVLVTIYLKYWKKQFPNKLKYHKG